MLDSITLRLDYYRDVFEMLYELYIMLTSIPQLAMRPTSIFILRTCLGWLFDQPNVPNEYYQYRQNRKPLDVFNSDVLQKNFISVQIMVPKDAEEYFNKDDKVMLLSNYNNDDDGHLNCTLEQTNSKLTTIEKYDKREPAFNLNKFDPLLENILIAACPFLADFRVSIMPRRNSKTVSRSGRYRHVTTKIYESPANKMATTKVEESTQTRLIDAFLQSQSLSVRKTVEFVLERTVSAVIKDFQVEYFIPMKKNVLTQVGSIQIDGKQSIDDQLYGIYRKGETQLSDKWNEVLPSMTKIRVQVCKYSYCRNKKIRRKEISRWTFFFYLYFQKAFEALLPNETIDAVRSTCINIVVQKCQIRTEEWKASNLVGIGKYRVLKKDL